MVGFGTIINVVAIVVGGLLGMLFGKKLKSGFQEALTRISGLCVLFLGIGGTMEKMLTVSSSGTLKSGGTMMIIGSLVIGAVIGELINIEKWMERFGEWLKKKTKSDKDASFVDGFVTASLTVCIGAMAVVGSIKDGISGDYSVLVTKAVLDFIIVLIMSSSMGKGCLFSAIPVGICQGIITLLAKLIEPVLTTAALDNLSLVGSIMIFCVGLNLIWGKKIKVANLLPAIIISVLWAYLPI